MKKIAMMLAACAAFTFAACGSANESDSDSNKSCSSSCSSVCSASDSSDVQGDGEVVVYTAEELEGFVAPAQNEGETDEAYNARVEDAKKSFVEQKKAELEGAAKGVVEEGKEVVEDGKQAVENGVNTVKNGVEQGVADGKAKAAGLEAAAKSEAAKYGL